MKFLIKLDRFFAWVLFGGMLLYFVSGYGMTKGIIDVSFATKIHLNFLTYIILMAFTFHTFYAIHLAFKRWRIWGGPAKVLLVSFFVAFFGSFVYIDRYYQISKQIPVESSPSESVSNTNSEAITLTNSNSNSALSTEETFTISQLSKYNGKNGQSAYVAVDGNIYDLTSVFNNGSHFSHYAGTELTNAFYTRHAKSALSKFPIVGKLVK
ncbi:MAG: cytochrome b5 domain-containing protein [Patescibacteria group bacterium]|jgi:predicted heme/steroid binding protein